MGGGGGGGGGKGVGGGGEARANFYRSQGRREDVTGCMLQCPRTGCEGIMGRLVLTATHHEDSQTM